MKGLFQNVFKQLWTSIFMSTNKKNTSGFSEKFHLVLMASSLLLMQERIVNKQQVIIFIEKLGSHLDGSNATVVEISYLITDEMARLNKMPNIPIDQLCGDIAKYADIVNLAGEDRLEVIVYLISLGLKSGKQDEKLMYFIYTLMYYMGIPEKILENEKVVDVINSRVSSQHPDIDSKGAKASFRIVSRALSRTNYCFNFS